MANDSIYACISHVMPEDLEDLDILIEMNFFLDTLMDDWGVDLLKNLEETIEAGEWHPIPTGCRDTMSVH